MEVLRRKQKGEDPYLSKGDVLDLAFLARISSQLPARSVWVAGCRGPPVRIYSDASFAPGDTSPGIGWVILKPGRSVQRRAARVPVEVMEPLLVRKTQIYAAEAYAVLAAVYEQLTDLKNTDAVFFVNNEAACAASIRRSSTQSDVGAVVNAVHWMLFSINCRPWFEWIDSASN